MQYKKRRAHSKREFVSWQPSTWPPAPKIWTPDFHRVVRAILTDTMLAEIRNVIEDAHRSIGTLEHRGHVVGLSLLCALEAVASYGYRGKRMEHFVKAHFPDSYRMHAGNLYGMYRNSLVHSWNLFEAALCPGDEPIVEREGMLSFGLLNFYAALRYGIEDFLARLNRNNLLQERTSARYEQVRRRARAWPTDGANPDLEMVIRSHPATGANLRDPT